MALSSSSLVEALVAFEALDRSKPRRRRNKTPTVHVYTTECRRSPGLVDVRIRLTRPLMEQLGWSENERVNVLVGTGEHAGQILLQPNKSGMFQFRRSTQSVSSYVLSSRAIPLPAGIKTRAEFEVQAEGLIVTWTSKPN